MNFIITDHIPDSGSKTHDLKNRNIFAVDIWNQLLRNDSLKHHRKLHDDLMLLGWFKNIYDTVDPNAAYAGHFDARSRSITIQEADETIYHELGHFLAFIAGNVDQSSAFASVYNSEKAKFTGYNKAYATQNAAEYFAESVKDYMLNGAALSSQRPNTYKAIQSALNTVTTARADAILKAYSSIWN